jgi:hypothetical protein
MPSRPQIFSARGRSRSQRMTRIGDQHESVAIARNGTRLRRCSSVIIRSVCLGCGAIGRVTAAEVVDHVESHKGNAPPSSGTLSSGSRPANSITTLARRPRDGHARRPFMCWTSYCVPCRSALRVNSTLEAWVSRADISAQVLCFGSFLARLLASAAQAAAQGIELKG